MTMHESKDGAEVAARTEQRWATISVIIVITVTLMAAGAGVYQATMPQARVETVDPSRLHVSDSLNPISAACSNRTAR